MLSLMKIYQPSFKNFTEKKNDLRLLLIICVFVSCVSQASASLSIAALRSTAGKGLTSWLLLVMFIVFCYIPMWYPGSGVVLDCIVT